MTQTDRRTFFKHTAGTLAAAAILPELEALAMPRVAEPINVGVVGFGRQGRLIIEQLRRIENVQVAAVCDVNPSRLGRTADRAPGAETFADFRQLLDKRKDIGAMVVATPTHLHKDIAIGCIQAGRHVYVEAPIAHTVEDGKAIAAAARGSQKAVVAGLLARSNPIYQLARTFFRSDSVRNVIGLRGQHNQSTTWRMAASSPEQEKLLNWALDPEVSLGLPGEMGTHQFDVFHWYLGRYPVEVRGRGAVRVHDDGRKVYDTIWCTLAFEDGAVLQYEATLGSRFEGRHEVLYGSNATIKLAWTAGWMFKEAESPTQGWEVYANRQQFHNDEGITLIADATQLAAQGKLKEGVGLPNPPLYYAVADFIRSISEAKPPATTIDEGLRATIVGILCQKAVATGETVKVDPELLK